MILLLSKLKRKWILNTQKKESQVKLRKLSDNKAIKTSKLKLKLSSKTHTTIILFNKALIQKD